jgi:hypothetical protein
MTNSTAEYLPLEKTWYSYTDEGAALPETEAETEVESASATDGMPTESNAAESESAPQGGCRAALCSTAGLPGVVTAGAVGAGMAATKKKTGKERA